MKNVLAVIDYPDYRVTFLRGSVGFPSSIVLKLRHDKEYTLIDRDEAWLRIKVNGETISPRLADDRAKPIVYRREGAMRVEFPQISFAKTDGTQLPGWRLTLHYEFWPEGVCFFNVFFGAPESLTSVFEEFSLRIPMEMEGGMTYGYWNRPKHTDGSAIQAIDSFVRNRTDKRPLNFSSVLPLIAFDFGGNADIAYHMEWIAEGQNAIAPGEAQSDTRLLWENDSPVLLYRFLQKPIRFNSRPCQWRNQFGFVLGQTPKMRNKAPLRLYHDLDLSEPFPSNRLIEKMAAEGADALILHEGWRADLQNGGAASNPDELARVVRTAHGNGMRVALYVRGNELSVQEDLASWFGHTLKKNYDGLYVDYGGPVHYHTADENYPGGRFAFKMHYHTLRRLRAETIGRDGLLILHTGPFFCGTVLGAVADAYTSGEGEKGIMLAGRREHAYFSESTVSAGSLWTAAFPGYETKEMLPYMANIGQFPHVTLGTQIPGSSLAHARETGCVTYARPLWKYYGLMAGERNIGFSNDLCDESIHCENSDTGAALYTMRDGSQLLLVSNFLAESAVCGATVEEWEEKRRGIRLLATEEGTEKEEMELSSRVEIQLPPYGVGAILRCTDSAAWEERIACFLRPYPPMDEADRDSLRQVKEMFASRFLPKPASEQYMVVSIPDPSIAWEDSVWWDLYHSVYELYITPGHGKRRKMGYIGRGGFTIEPPHEEEMLMPGQSTPVISLHTLLPKGNTLVELRASHYGEDFYSFVTVLCSASPDMTKSREIQFLNKLDSDRSRLTFRVRLI